jgi:hypothetical protein
MSAVEAVGTRSARTVARSVRSWARGNPLSGRPAIPYNQTSTAGGKTGGDGWATLRFRILRGFPANP